MKGWEKIFHSNENYKKAGVTLLIFDKRVFKMRTIVRHRGKLYNDKEVNPARRYNIYQYACTKHISTKIYKGHTKKSIGRK